MACDGRGACTVVFALSVAPLRLRALLVAIDAVPIHRAHTTFIAGPVPSDRILCASACDIAVAETMEGAWREETAGTNIVTLGPGPTKRA